MTDREMIEQNLAEYQDAVDGLMKKISKAKAALIKLLPGYIEPGKVMVYGGKRTDQWGRIKVATQSVVLTTDGWVIEHTYGRGVFPDDSYSVRLPIRFIDHYHPEEVPSG